MKKENKIGLLSVIGLVVLILIFVFIILPAQESTRLNVFKNNKVTKIGKIILVVPNEKKIYFEDGIILNNWQREDCSKFLNYINKEVRIVYGELKICNDCSADERMLFKIIELR